MTIKEVKHVAIEFTPEDDNSIKKVYNLMRELSNALAKICIILIISAGLRVMLLLRRLRVLWVRFHLMANADAV